jgi:hypothetical protein
MTNIAIKPRQNLTAFFRRDSSSIFVPERDFVVFGDSHYPFNYFNRQVAAQFGFLRGHRCLFQRFASLGIEKAGLVLGVTEAKEVFDALPSLQSLIMQSLAGVLHTNYDF